MGCTASSSTKVETLNNPVETNTHQTQRNSQSSVTHNDKENISEEKVDQKTSPDSYKTYCDQTMDEYDRSGEYAEWCKKKYGLWELDIPTDYETRQMKDFTVDDLAVDRSLVKFGRNVYSFDIMLPILKERVKQLERHGDKWMECYSRFKPFRNDITRKERKQLLPVCQVGHFVDLPHDTYLSRMKPDVENILNPDAVEKEHGVDSDHVADIKQQLLRWLRTYPNVQTENKLPEYNTDPNDTPFPICIDNPSLFQKWVVEWEAFDMTIDGEAGWNVIALDLVKNDSTTEEQEKIWSQREKRSNLNDPERMVRRRKDLVDKLLHRHGHLKPDIMELYLGFADHLEENWKLFQELCNKDFDPPQKYKTLYNAIPSENINLSSEALDTNENAIDCNAIAYNENIGLRLFDNIPA